MGVAYDPMTNKLYAMGGDANGGGFFDSTNLVDELPLGSWPAGSWVILAAEPDIAESAGEPGRVLRVWRDLECWGHL
jgi:hypothetical protein